MPVPPKGHRHGACAGAAPPTTILPATGLAGLRQRATLAFASLESGDDDAPLTEINMVPLIDVMLVLLIIFIVTAPLLTHAVKVDLPKAALGQPDQTGQRATRDRRRRQVFWNGEAVDASAFNARLQAAGIQQPQPEIHIRAERVHALRKVAQGDVGRRAQRAQPHRLRHRSEFRRALKFSIKPKESPQCR